MTEGESFQKFEAAVNVPEGVLRALGTGEHPVDYRGKFLHPDFGDSDREQSVHVNLSRGGTHLPNHLNFSLVNQGRSIGAFGTQDTGDALSLTHRRVDPEYQGFGLAGMVFDLHERLAATVGKDFVVDVAEPDVKIGDDLDAVGIQLDTLAALEKRGFVPADAESAKVLKDLRGETSMKIFDFVDLNDSGHKAVRKDRQPVSLVMKKPR